MIGKKKFKSTVLCCAFHPTNGQLLATGSSDFKCRIFSTFTADVDGTAVNPGPFANGIGPLEFGEVYAELSALGWINAVAWSPSGNILAYTGHDSSVHFVDLTTAKPNVDPVERFVRLAQLPLCSLMFISEHALVGGGHDFNPTLFTCASNGTWSFNCYIDKVDSKSSGSGIVATGVSAARELFKNKTSRGQDLKDVSDTLKTCHENAITNLHDASPSSTGANTSNIISTISTSSLDGRLVIWHLPSLDINMAALKI